MVIAGAVLYYNFDGLQQPDDTPICGHLCLVVLKELSDCEEYNKISHEINHDREYWERYVISYSRWLLHKLIQSKVTS